MTGYVDEDGPLARRGDRHAGDVPQNDHLDDVTPWCLEGEPLASPEQRRGPSRRLARRELHQPSLGHELTLSGRMNVMRPDGSVTLMRTVSDVHVERLGHRARPTRPDSSA